MNDNNELLIQILQTLNNFQLQTAASFTELRSKVEENKKEIEISRQIENEHWQENLRRWEENKMLWKQNTKDRERDHSELLDILLKFDITISKRIGDPNAEKMEKYLKVR